MRTGSLRRRTAVALAVVGLVTACTPGTQKSSDNAQDDSGPARIEFWTINLKKNFSGYIQGMIDRYHKDHPDVTVRWVDIPGADVKQKLLSAIASGDTPDVVNLTNIDLEQFVPSLADLGKYVTPEQREQYIPSLLAPLQRDGKLVAIPWYNGGAPIAVVNTDLVRKAGLNPHEPPKTFDEALSWGAKVHQANPKTYGMNGIPDASILQMEGIDILSADRKKAAFNTPEAAAVLDKWRAGFKNGAIAPGATVKDERQYPQTLDNQQVAFSANTLPFNLLNIQKNAPDVYRKLEVAPGAVGGSRRYLLPDQQTFVVPAASKHRKAAADFTLYITNAANQTAFCKLVPIYPSTEESLKDPFFSTFKQGNLMDEARKVIAGELPKLKLGFYGTGKDDELNERFSEHIRAFLMGSKSAKQTLGETEKEWNDILAGKS
ncbi:ABC transporter substrate-binding protein [Streptomyces spiralis]|uniref:ABC transporter substrate-binding protein n=1 Tax=Streptomyces spiralis TaxID=66376 RepID=UPI0036C9FFAE